MNFVKRVIVTGACLAVTVGSGRPPAPAEIMNQTPVYTEATPIIESAPGEEITVALDSNPTTGYSWDFVEEFDRRILTLVDSRYQPPQTQLKGAGGTQFWTFRALETGRTEIKLKYFRSWEKGVPPVREVVFTVIVGNSDR